MGSCLSGVSEEGNGPDRLKVLQVMSAVFGGKIQRSGRIQRCRSGRDILWEERDLFITVWFKDIVLAIYRRKHMFFLQKIRFYRYLIYYRHCRVFNFPPGEEDLGSDADHPAGHDGAGRLRRLPELHPQPVLRVGQVQRVGRLLEQTESGQEAGQPSGDGALLLHCERTAQFILYSVNVYTFHKLSSVFCEEILICRINVVE